SAILSMIVLLYQALFLAHGGLTTLGANVVSMGIAGPVIACVVYRTGMRAGLNFYLTVFLATAMADLATYMVTAIELSLSFPAQAGGVMASFRAFAAIFALTQLPLAIMEGAITALIFKYVIQIRGDALVKLDVIGEAGLKKIRELTI
ncbi:MAG: energy-coupling factor ABC transporter permease, partial [ANME-2 cluster archaeon]|nr:energy-coupling factor ABC transporter permease [ANME-2 cluster archaeon]